MARQKTYPWLGWLPVAAVTLAQVGRIGLGGQVPKGPTLTDLADSPLARRTLAKLGDADFSAADFFEAYADAIEEQAKQLAEVHTKIQRSVRYALEDLLAYFDEPSDHYQDWPQSGLRALAMLSPIHVAAGVLGLQQETLELAIRSQRPNKSWAWWRALGVAILAGAPLSDIATQFDLAPRAMKRYVQFLVGSVEAARRAA